MNKLTFWGMAAALSLGLAGCQTTTETAPQTTAKPAASTAQAQTATVAAPAKMTDKQFFAEAQDYAFELNTATAIALVCSSEGIWLKQTGPLPASFKSLPEQQRKRYAAQVTLGTLKAAENQYIASKRKQGFNGARLAWQTSRDKSKPRIIEFMRARGFKKGDEPSALCVIGRKEITARSAVGKLLEIRK